MSNRITELAWLKYFVFPQTFCEEFFSILVYIPTLVSSSQLWLMPFLPILFVIIK